MLTHWNRALLLSCFSVLVACSSPELANTTDQGVNAIQFQDVAVPAGMRLHDNYHESHSREEAGWRYGHFLYTGQPRVQEACEHVLQRMPQHAWTLVSDAAPDDHTRNLKFTRGRYTVEYAVTRQDGVTQLVVDYRTEIPSQ
jgi:hypothetical protein